MTTGMPEDICWGDRLVPLPETDAGPIPVPVPVTVAELELEQSSNRNVAFSRMVVYTSALAIRVVDLTPKRFSSLASGGRIRTIRMKNRN